MAKDNKSNNKKEKTTKNKKTTSPKPTKKVEKVKEEVFDGVFDDEIEEKEIAGFDIEKCVNGIVEVIKETIEKDGIFDDLDENESEPEKDEIIYGEMEFPTVETMLEEEKKETNPLTQEPKKNTMRILNEESSQYETLPLKPMKRDPKNIFFNVKKKIKMIFE